MTRGLLASALVIAFLILTLLSVGCTTQPNTVPEIVTSAPQTQATLIGGYGIPVGLSEYTFNDTRGNADRPITVYTYRPASWNVSGQILIAMHGAGRDGEPTRDTWIAAADKYSCLIIAPEFSFQNYPGDQWYIGGNVMDQNGTIQPQANWTYTAIEHLFDDVKSRTGAQRDTYLLFGHSAGGQFVHRFVTLLPNARYTIAVAANAGVYLMPTYSVVYGFGLYESPLPASELPLVFSRKLVIMSGGADTNPNDSSLANFPAAEAQGATRFDRAKKYYATAQQEAVAIGAPLNWEYHVIPGVGHDEGAMAAASVPYLFGNG